MQFGYPHIVLCKFSGMNLKWQNWKDCDSILFLVATTLSWQLENYHFTISYQELDDLLSETWISIKR